MPVTFDETYAYPNMTMGTHQKLDDALRLVNVEYAKRILMHLISIVADTEVIGRFLTGRVLNVSIGSNSTYYSIRDVLTSADGGIAMLESKAVMKCCIGNRRRYWNASRLSQCRKSRWLCYGLFSVDRFRSMY